jgi:hypothetical protein
MAQLTVLHAEEDGNEGAPNFLYIFGWVWYGSPFWRREIKCFGTAQRAVPHAEEDGNECAPNLRAAEAVDVEVERKVHQLQIVGHRAEHLRITGNIG